MSVIAIDYDNTITDNTPFPHEGNICSETKDIIKQLYEAGHTLVLWTSRKEPYYTECVERLKKEHLYEYFTSIEDVCISGETGKIQADVYVDDRSCKSLKQLVNQYGNKVYVSWEDVENFVQYVVNTVKDDTFSGVYGLPRGGLVLATMVSYKLNIPLLMAPAPNCIIVDDICDTGESLLHYYKNSSGVKQKHTIITMYYKENDLVIPDYWQYKKSDKWIIFPWE